jgi:aminopeptidase N
MVRDGELPPEEFLGVVRDHAPGESEVAVLEGVLSFARETVADCFLPAERRGGALELLGGVCREVLSRTGGAAVGGGAGLRLTAVRQFIDCASDPGELYGWWEAGSVPGGPVLDAELRWRLLLRLSVLGGVGGGEIDAELAADPSAAGAEGAARCRAALPDAAGKEAAWEAMFVSDGLSNYLLRATARGFWQPEQRELLTGGGFAERYFADAVPVAARRGAAVAAIVGRWAFPRTVVDEGVLRRGAECVEGEGVTPSLRRALVDQLDDLRRAVLIRSRAGVLGGE